MFPIGYNGQPGTLEDLNKLQGWSRLDPVFRSRLLSLFAAAGGQLGFGEGWRSTEWQQREYDRRRRTGEGAPMAPGGMSWHEVGVAADLVGPAVNNGWLEANAAKYGLKTFAGVNNEPWHVQPIEVPNGRSSNQSPPALSGTPDGGFSAMTPTGASTTAQRFNLPSDAKVVNIAGTYEVYAVFDVGGVSLAYDVVNSGANWKNLPLHKVSRDQWQQTGAVMAGNGNELVTVSSTFGNFKSFWDSILMQVIGPANPARNDPDVLKVIAEFAARPDMQPVELQNKLQATNWWRTRTTAELEWNGLADAEKDKRRQEAAARAAETWQQFLGQPLSPDDPRIRNYLEDLASGKMGWGAFTEVVKQQAAAVPESPYFRQLRDENEAQRQRPIDLENTAQRIRDTLNRWGLQWTPTNIQDWARQIVEKNKSDEDLMNTIKQQAVTLFPWKDPEMETIEAAQPWLATYGRVMEQEANLFTPRIQAALTAGKPAWEFEQELKRSDQWLTTRNARQDMFGMISEAGRKLGFV